jgi:catechol 2,3-dioxygenase-like lactoylglutathione lyase family enzyme
LSAGLKISILSPHQQHAGRLDLSAWWGLGRDNDTNQQSEEIMATPKIRHLAIFARDPHAMARYYQKVFDMKLVHTSPDGQHCFVSDGYLTMALLKHTTNGSAPIGLNHFGFSVENRAEIERRIKELGMEAPTKRPSDRPFAEVRAADPEGNFFYISQHGFEMVETDADRTKSKVSA